MTSGTQATKSKMTKAERRAESIRHILDCAERLFAERGFHGVSLKDIAADADVHHTLIHYYFGDKNAVVDAVFARRAPLSCQRRMEALKEYEREAAGAPTVEGALSAFLSSYFDLYQEQPDEWKYALALGAQVANAPDWGADIMEKHFDPVVQQLIDILEVALPACSREDLYWGYHFVTGAFMLTLARTGRIDKLSDGLCRSDDLPSARKRLSAFMAAGFRALHACRQAGLSAQDMLEQLPVIQGEG